MLIKRKNKPEKDIHELGYMSAQVVSDHVITPTEGALEYVENSGIGQAAPVKKKTRMVRNAITGIKAYMPKKKKTSNNKTK